MDNLSFHTHPRVVRVGPRSLLTLPLLILASCAPKQPTAAPLPSGFKSSRPQPDPSPVQDPNAPPGSTGNVKSGAGPQAASASAVVTNGMVASSQVKFAKGVPEDAALRKCINLWGNVPFPEVKKEHVKIMPLNVSIGGDLLKSTPLSALGAAFNLGNTKDLEITTDPRLIIVPLSVNVGGNATFELMNPKGWYCLKRSLGLKSTINIKLHCSAKLAQSEMGVNLSTVRTASTSSTTGGSALPVKVSVNSGATEGGPVGMTVDSSVSFSRVDSNGNASCGAP